MPLPKYNFGAHFLSAKTFSKLPFFREPGCARIFCAELEAARQAYDFQVWAFVLMPDHFHLVVWWDEETLPDLTISKVAWRVKGKSARRIVACLKASGQAESPQMGNNTWVGEGNAFPYPGDVLRAVRQPLDKPHFRNWQYKIWQKGAGYDFNIYTYGKLLEKIAYIHANPVRAGLVSRPEDYAWSSAADYLGLPSPHGVCITMPEAGW